MLIRKPRLLDKTLEGTVEDDKLSVPDMELASWSVSSWRESSGSSDDNS